MAGTATATLRLKPFDVVVVPFPFTDRDSSKRRPALVLSSADFNQASGHCVLAMITSADQSSWIGDAPISNLKAAGLPQPCLVRMKLFTLDQRLVVRIAGSLFKPEQKRLKESWAALLPMAP